MCYVELIAYVQLDGCGHEIVMITAVPVIAVR
jgi:hypothetical protein